MNQVNQTHTYVLVLEPARDLSQLVMDYKARTGELVGDQLYLQDPPHLTLYVAPFPDHDRLRQAFSDFAPAVPAVDVSIQGWHVFAADPLTGKQTLVCQLATGALSELRQIQLSAIRAVASLRDQIAVRGRYSDSWHALTSAERENVESYGFPFVGEGWHPHISIASIDPADWEIVWQEMQGNPPFIDSQLARLALYVLEENLPVMVDRVDL